MLPSISIPFSPEYYTEFVAKNNTSAREHNNYGGKGISNNKINFRKKFFHINFCHFNGIVEYDYFTYSFSVHKSITVKLSKNQ